MKAENKVLKFSAIGGLFFAILGIAWGWALNSEMIKFDGLYSLISLGLAIFSIIVTNFINKSDFENYPFGKYIAEPLLVIFKSVILLMTCSYSMISSVKEIINGGNLVNEGAALAYSLISSLGCIVVYLYMKKESKNLNSEIVNIESKQWLMDTILSVGVLIGFIVGIIFKFIGLTMLSNYIDPVMVLISSLMFLRMPIESILSSLREITNSSIDEDINIDINKLIKEIERDYNIDDTVIRVAKVGRQLRIEIDFIVSDTSKVKSIEDMDRVREIIDKNTNHFDLKKWLNISFTKNKKWAI